MRGAFIVSLLGAASVGSCGGLSSSVPDEGVGGRGGSGGASSGGVPGPAGGAGGSERTEAGGGAPQGGASSGGASSGGASSGGASSGGASSGGASSGVGGSDPLDPAMVGSTEKSCGGNMWSLDGETFLDCRVGGEHAAHPDCVIVDCTAYGDTGSVCVFSNHCWCSEGFVCAGGEMLGNECEPRFSCVALDGA